MARTLPSHARGVCAPFAQPPGIVPGAAEQGGELVAYLAAYWSRLNITPLNGDFADCDDASVLYPGGTIWPCPRLPPARLGGAHGPGPEGPGQSARRAAHGTGFGTGSRLHWERQGYAVQSVTNAVQQQHLDKGGEGALYMVGFI